MGGNARIFLRNLNQERIVLIVAVLIFGAAVVGLPGFLTAANLISIVRSIAVLGILALGISVVIIGRGLDLSMVALLACSVAWYLSLLHNRRCARPYSRSSRLPLPPELPTASAAASLSTPPPASPGTSVVALWPACITPPPLTAPEMSSTQPPALP